MLLAALTLLTRLGWATDLTAPTLVLPPALPAPVPGLLPYVAADLHPGEYGRFQDGRILVSNAMIADFDMRLSANGGSSEARAKELAVLVQPVVAHETRHAAIEADLATQGLMRANSAEEETLAYIDELSNVGHLLKWRPALRQLIAGSDYADTIADRVAVWSKGDERLSHSISLFRGLPSVLGDPKEVTSRFEAHLKRLDSSKPPKTEAEQAEREASRKGIVEFISLAHSGALPQVQDYYHKKLKEASGARRTASAQALWRTLDRVNQKERRLLVENDLEYDAKNFLEPKDEYFFMRHMILLAGRAHSDLGPKGRARWMPTLTRFMNGHARKWLEGRDGAGLARELGVSPEKMAPTFDKQLAEMREAVARFAR